MDPKQDSIFEGKLRSTTEHLRRSPTHSSRIRGQTMNMDQGQQVCGQPSAFNGENPSDEEVSLSQLRPNFKSGSRDADDIGHDCFSESQVAKNALARLSNGESAFTYLPQVKELDFKVASSKVSLTQ